MPALCLFWLSVFLPLPQIELHRPIDKLAELAAFLPRPIAVDGCQVRSKTKRDLLPLDRLGRPRWFGGSATSGTTPVSLGWPGNLLFLLLLVWLVWHTSRRNVPTLRTLGGPLRGRSLWLSRDDVS